MKTNKILSNLYSYLFLSLFALMVILPGLATLPILDRDSAHFAQATRQIVESNNYYEINFQNLPRHLKPPGIYWLQAISVKLFSNAHSHKIWPYRIPSALGGLFSILLTFYFAKQFYQKKVAFLAAALLGSSFLLIVESHIATTDAVLLITMILMQGSLWQIYVRSRQNFIISKYLIALFWLSMSAGLLIKGITPVVGFLTLITLVVVDRSFTIFTKVQWVWGLFLLITITLLWLIPLSLEGHSNFLLDMIRGDVVPKLVGGQESHGMPPGYFFITFSLTFWVGALWFWYGAIWGWQQRKNSVERFLLCWIIPSWVFFELIPTKLPEYLLPVYPAIAILIAKAIIDNHLLLWNKVTRILNQLETVAWTCLGIVIATSIILLPWYFIGHITVSSIYSVIVLLFTIVFVLINNYQQQQQRAAIICIIGTALSFFSVWQWELPNLKPLWISQTITKQVAGYTKLSTQNSLLSVGYIEPSLVFLTDTKHVQFATPQLAVTQLQQSNDSYIIVDSTEQQQFLDLAEKSAVKLQKLSTITGFDYNRGKWITLVLYRKEIT